MNNVSVLFAMAQVASVAVGFPSAGDVRLVPPSRESRSGGGIPKQCEFACCGEKIRTACQHSFLREANGPASDHDCRSHTFPASPHKCRHGAHCRCINILEYAEAALAVSVEHAEHLDGRRRVGRKIARIAEALPCYPGAASSSVIVMSNAFPAALQTASDQSSTREVCAGMLPGAPDDQVEALSSWG